MMPRHALEIPFRALAMPHQWYFWLARRNLLTRNHGRELLFNYGLIATVFGTLALVVGPARVAWGMGPVLVLVSVLLWVPFALKTHEGHSVGSSETRSHDYYGRLMYWFSLGLSMHRVHHENPQLSWVELKSFVQPAPEGSWGGLIPRRDVRVSPSRGAAIRLGASALLLTALAAGLAPSTARAQWRVLSTPGYAAGGMAAAAGPAFAANSIGSGVTIFGVGLVAGAITGWLIGDAADDRLARGETLSSRHKHALRAGTVMAGAGAGAIAAFFVINGDDEASDISDEPNDGATFASFVAVGAALGVLTQVLIDSRLEPASLQAGLSLEDGSRPGLALRLEF
jgi:hypothetical protein